MTQNNSWRIISNCAHTHTNFTPPKNVVGITCVINSARTKPRKACFWTSFLNVLVFLAGRILGPVSEAIFLSYLGPQAPNAGQWVPEPTVVSLSWFICLCIQEKPWRSPKFPVAPQHEAWLSMLYLQMQKDLSGPSGQKGWRGSASGTMRAEIIADMIYSEGSEYPEHAMHFYYPKYSGTPKYRNMLGKFSPSLCVSANRKLPKVFGAPGIQEYVLHCLLHKAFPGILQVIVRNGMVSQTFEKVRASFLGSGWVTCSLCHLYFVKEFPRFNRLISANFG